MSTTLQTDCTIRAWKLLLDSVIHLSVTCVLVAPHFQCRVIPKYKLDVIFVSSKYFTVRLRE